MMTRRRLIVSAAAVLLASATAGHAECMLTPIGTAKVTAVRDGRTLQLADGRVLRLAAIEVTAASRRPLERLTAGRSLRLMRLGPEQDRYGRLYAFAFAGDRKKSLQTELLENGEARVSARVGDTGCAEVLLKAERSARAARRGLWADPRFYPLASEDLPRIIAEKGRFALIEGKVVSVHPSGGSIYLNFGRDWTRDFSVVILRRNKRLFVSAGLAPERLEGRQIRVRGWIELRRGPVIEAVRPEQIELAEHRTSGIRSSGSRP